MKAIFSIHSQESIPEDVQLAIQWSADQISFLIYKKDPVKIYHLSVYQNEAGVDSEQMATHLRSFLDAESYFNRSFGSIYLYYDTNESCLVPTEFYNGETLNDVLNLQFGELPGAIAFSDFIPQSDMVNIYRMPANIHRAFMDIFPLARINHASTELLGKEVAAGNTLKLIVGQKSFEVYFFSNQQLMLHQYFPYQTPEDVAYHCLNICSQMNVPADACALILSGFIEADSGLYKCLHKYFLQANFIVPDERLHEDNAFENYPAHMFYPITRKAICE